MKELPFEGDGLKGKKIQQESLVKACWGWGPNLKGFCLLFLEKLLSLRNVLDTAVYRPHGPNLGRALRESRSPSQA